MSATFATQPHFNLIWLNDNQNENLSYVVVKVALYLHVSRPFIHSLSLVVCVICSAGLAPDDAAEDPGGQSDEDDDEPKDGSIYGEELEQQIGCSRRWLRQGLRFADDLAMVRIPLAFAVKWLMQQLIVSGNSWEVRQQRRLLEHGRRDYRLLLAYDSKETYDFMDGLTRIMFNDREWELVQVRTEARQLEAFLAVLRLGAMGHQLVLHRNRKTPYKTFHSLRDPEWCEQLRTSPHCTLDPYTINMLKFYEGMCDSECAKAELQTILEICETDTVSTERLHSTNNSRTLHRSSTHKMDLPTLDAYYIGRQTRAAERSADAISRKRRAVPRPEPEQRRRGGGGAWRAFLHVHARGQACTGDYFTEMSRRFGRLTAEEKNHYIELGRIGTDLHRRMHKAFEKAPRRHGRPPLRNLGGGEEQRGVGPGAVGLEDGVIGGGDHAPQEGQPRVGNVGDAPRMQQDAQLALATERLERRREEEIDVASEQLLTAYSAEHVAAEVDNWGLGDAAGGAAIVPSVCPSFRCHTEAEPPSLDTINAVAGGRTQEQMCEEWRSMHRCIMHADCEALVAPTVQRRLCWEAGRCVHLGDARVDALFHDALIKADRTLKQRMGKKWYDKGVCERGAVVLRVFCEHDDLHRVGGVAPGALGAVLAGAVAEAPPAREAICPIAQGAAAEACCIHSLNTLTSAGWRWGSRVSKANPGSLSVVTIY